jgi:hypothetical protein
MKQSIFRACIGALLAVCAFSASAGDLKPAFKADNGKVFTIAADNLGFACEPGTVKVTQSNTNAFTFPDATGAVCTKVTSSPDFYGNYVQQPSTPTGTKVYHRATWIEAYCNGSAQSVLSYNVNGGPTVLSDGCQTDAQIKARAN